MESSFSLYLVVALEAKACELALLAEVVSARPAVVDDESVEYGTTLQAQLWDGLQALGPWVDPEGPPLVLRSYVAVCDSVAKASRAWVHAVAAWCLGEEL